MLARKYVVVGEKEVVVVYREPDDVMGHYLEHGGRTLIGALIIQVVRIGMTFMGVSVFAQHIGMQFFRIHQMQRLHDGGIRHTFTRRILVRIRTPKGVQKK